jgi:hypothetical protein
MSSQTKRNIGKIAASGLLTTFFAALIIWCFLPARPTQAALTKTTAFDTIDAWQLLNAASLAVGNAESVSASYKTIVYIEVALTSANAQAGCDVIVEISYADDDWMQLTTFKGTAETPATTTLNDAAANAGDASITLTDATTGDFDVPGRKWFIVDGTVANSESVKTQVNAVHTVTLCQDLLRSHADALNVWDRVDEWPISIPIEAAYVRVLINNTDADASVHWRSFCSKVSALN